jgi:predicted dehydrogenase
MDEFRCPKVPRRWREMLKVGFVGAGFVAKFHATALRSVRQVELAGVTALAGAEALSAEIQKLGVGAGTVYPSVGELCKNVDVVAIFAPNYARLEVMQAIAEARSAGAEIKGVICEKPLARNVKEAEVLVTLARDAAFLTAYFENQIHMPAVRNARAQLAGVEQAMGPVHLTRSAEEHGGPHEAWFWDPTRQGGGVLCDMGCHSIAVGWYMLTPSGKDPRFLTPRHVSAQTMLLKWGLDEWRSKLKERGVDYSKTPAEDYATGAISFQNPETKQQVVAQFTDSWMYDAPGLRLLMEALGPGYSYTVNSLESPAGLFISDDAATAVVDGELALEKSQASRGALILQPNEADLYGYVDEWRDAAAAFAAQRDAHLNWEYGLDITRLVMASYMSAEKGATIDLGDPKVVKELASYIPAIQAGNGWKVFAR